jgi:carboxyl-terminal processing protease
MRSRTLIALAAGAIFGFSAAFAGGALAEGSSAHGAAGGEADGLPWQEARQFAEVYERIRHDYVDKVSSHALMDAAIRGMVSALDPHSAYLNSEQFEQTRLSTRGAYPGVGIEVAAAGSAVKVLHTLTGSPADRAGVRAGDEIVQINGKDVEGDVRGAIANMRGVAGTQVSFTIRRPGTAGLLHFTMRRANLQVHSVASETLVPGIVYLRITSFTFVTPKEVTDAILALKRNNPGGLRGLVLDLRDNPGGVMESGVAVADDFITEGVILTAQGRTRDARFTMDATPGDLLNGAPMVVLVNSGTASAAEILAGALKDHGRALLMGHATYGKGTVQTVIPLAYGGAIKLTTSRYFTPSGGSVQGRGIMPDIVVDSPEQGPADIETAKGAAPLQARDTEVRLALQTLEAEIRGHSRAHLIRTAARSDSAASIAGQDLP